MLPQVNPEQSPTLLQPRRPLRLAVAAEPGPVGPYVEPDQEQASQRVEREFLERNVVSSDAGRHPAIPDQRRKPDAERRIGVAEGQERMAEHKVQNGAPTRDEEEGDPHAKPGSLVAMAPPLRAPDKQDRNHKQRQAYGVAIRSQPGIVRRRRIGDRRGGPEYAAQCQRRRYQQSKEPGDDRPDIAAQRRPHVLLDEARKDGLEAGAWASHVDLRIAFIDGELSQPAFA